MFADFPLKKGKEKRNRNVRQSGLKILIVVKTHISISKMPMTQCLQVPMSIFEVLTDISAITGSIKITCK